jgi:predicted Zn-dependent protease
LLLLLLGCAWLAAGCATAPYTGRHQLLLTSESSEMAMGFQAFQAMKRQYPPCRDLAVNALVQQVGSRIAAAAHRPDFRWEFAVFQNDREANAFCLPGGKVGVFTGLLKYTRDETGLATVIAHEAAHALARHAGERLSQSLLAQVGSLGLGLGLGGANPYAGQAIAQGVDLGAQMGIMLPYSRKQELEADKIGLILLAKAGYDPAAALDFWQRLLDQEKRGPEMPQFLSTHPKDENRIAEMRAFLPEARKYYQPPGAWSAPAAPMPEQPAPAPGAPPPPGPTPNPPPAPAPQPPAPSPPAPDMPAPAPAPTPAPEPDNNDDLELKPMSVEINKGQPPAPPCGRWAPKIKAEKM